MSNMLSGVVGALGKKLNPSTGSHHQSSDASLCGGNWVENYMRQLVSAYMVPHQKGGHGSPEAKISYHSRHVMSSSPVPLKTHRVRQRCTLNLLRAQTSSRWCGVVVRRGGASSGVVHVT
ncbi:hypothetical protein TNCV_4707651 [Trichonephila clavipes]|nr:hypothetical protein TNCV_4707651 [Trichonephila clavipes]